MGSWIVVLVALSLMGSVFWVMPSTRDRLRMRLRQRAMAVGLKVRMPDQSLKERLIRYEDLILGSMMYECLNFSHQAVKFSGGLYVLKGQDDSWAFVEESIPLGIDKDMVLSAVESLPNSCGLLALTSNSAFVFWDERGDEKDVDVIQSVLDKVNMSMS